ncbi:MAG: sodium:solute symporter family protein, partial [Acetobacteraceae bacterium]|nr:sodium:solute symporter family protein [Acetobacteraceae bacterium]
LTALVPGSMILIAASTLVANNLYRALSRNASDEAIARLIKMLVPIVALLAVLFTLQGGNTIVALLLMGYSFVTQLFPSLLASLFRRNPVTAPGAIVGIVAGVLTVAATVLTHTTTATLLPFLPPPWQDLNIGIVALAINIVATICVSAVTRSRRGAETGSTHRSALQG